MDATDRLTALLKENEELRATALWERAKKYKLDSEPPQPTQFRLGDKVIFTNDYGVQFEEEVIGYSKTDPMYTKYGHFIHLLPTNGTEEAFWYPHRENQLTKIN